MKFPLSIQRLVNQFTQLPGIGPKAAERIVFQLLKRPQEDLSEFAQALYELKEHVHHCSQCHNISSSDPCSICSDEKRDQTVLCVVNKPQDLVAIEKTKEYKGLYHVLWGTLNPLEGVTPEKLKIEELILRVSFNPIKEVILAFNADIEGDTTGIYLKERLEEFPIKLTTLARGLSTGSELEYADEDTLSSALSGRK